MRTVRKYIFLYSSFVFLSGLAQFSEAQNIGPATDYVHWSAFADPVSVSSGGSVQIRWVASIEDGWKMYAMDSPRPTRGVQIQIDDLPEGITSRGDIRQKDPTEGYDPNFGMNVRYFSDDASFEASLAVNERVEPGSYVVSGSIVFMICNETLCLPPTTVPFETNVSVQESTVNEGQSRRANNEPPDFSGGEDALSLQPAQMGADDEEESARPAQEMGTTASSDLDALRSGGFWAFLLLAAGAGLAALLTPCVFPMIPLTVSYFTKHTGDRSESVRMALVYGLSIVITFTLLGVLTALLVGAAGAQTIAANPWINLFIGLVFVVFALSLLGLFELRLPSGLLNFFNRQSSEQKGYFGVLFMGLTLTLVSFSCTVPFVGGLLAATASNEWFYPILGMLVFSATFSLPFVLFALFPKGLNTLPKSGSWMNTVKVVLGFIELAAALKFLSNADLVWGWGLLSRPLAVALIVVIFFHTGLYLIGKLRLLHDEPPMSVGVIRLLFGIVFFSIALYMLPGLFGAPLNAIDAYLPPRQGTDVSLVTALPGAGQGEMADDFNWFNDIDAAFETARQVNKPVFIDFTGYTCTNCRQMEANVLPRSEVATRLHRDYVLLRLFTDDVDLGPDLQRYQLQLTGTVALPTYAIVFPENRRLLSRLSGIASVERFVSFLEEGTSSFEQFRLAGR